MNYTPEQTAKIAQAYVEAHPSVRTRTVASPYEIRDLALQWFAGLDDEDQARILEPN